MPRSLFAATPALLLALVATYSAPSAAAPRPSPEVKGVVNLNTANEQQLRLLPGVGAKKAERIIEQRRHQKFQSTDQIMRVKGFGRMTYRKLKPHLAVDGATTISRPTAARTRHDSGGVAPGTSPDVTLPSPASGAPASGAPGSADPAETAEHAG